jgi:hypothetical protein
VNFEVLSKKLGSRLKNIPSLWDAQSAVLALSREVYPLWKQSEWLDFYFQYLCEKYLPRIVPMHKEVCGTTFFDGIHDLTPYFEQKISKNNSKKSTEKDILPKTSSEEFNHALNNYLHWRQMEWVEAYFNFLCEEKLSDLLKFPEPAYSQMHFPALIEIPWIFKSYIQNTGNRKIILSDVSLVIQALTNYHEIGVIIASGLIRYPEEKKEEVSHSGKYKEEIKNVMKEMRQHSEFILKKIHFVPISYDFLETCETFQPKEIKSEENLREKIVLEMPKVKDKIKYSINFS